MKTLGACVLLWLLSVAAVGQTKFDYFYLEAEKCRLAEDYASATELYRHCLNIRPDAPEAIYQLGIMNFYLREDSVGIAMLNRAVELDPGNPWYLSSLASVYLQKRDIEAAIPVLEQLSKLQTRRSDVVSQLASLYKQSGRTEDALRSVCRIEQLEGKSPRLSLKKFALLMDLQREEEAFAELDTLCSENPHDMSCRLAAANQYLHVGETQRAMELYDQVRKEDPSSEQLQLSLIGYYEETGQQPASVALRDSLLQAPGVSTQTKVALLVKKAAEQTGKKEDADQIAATMEQILEIEPGNELALSHLLQYYARVDNKAGIEDVCRRGMNCHPEELLFAYYLGIVLQADRKDEALEAWQAGLRARTEETNPQVVSDIFTAMGDVYQFQKRTEESFAAYDSALVYVPENIGCMNNYAYFLSVKGEQLDKAEEMSYRTIKAEPDNKTYLDTYAWILYMKKEYAEARHYMERILPPDASEEEMQKTAGELSPEVLAHASDIYRQCGMKEAVRRIKKLRKKTKAESLETKDERRKTNDE